MNKKDGIIITIVVALLIGVGIFFYLKNISSTPNESNYDTNRTAANNTYNQIENNNNINENTFNQTEENKNNKNQAESFSDTNEVTQGIIETQTSPPTIEEQIAAFTTKIYSADSARQNNISITCNTVNGTIVKNGTTFSFCNTVGPATSSKGYQKADIYDKNGNKKQGLGGRKLSN